MRRVRGVLTILVLAGVVGVTACHKTVPQAAVTAPPAPVPAAAPAVAPPPPPPPSPQQVEAPRALTEEELFARKSLDELNAEHPLADAFFDLDKSDIRNDAKPTLQKDAEWLRKWTSTRITVEGHCDERGSSEYNLALGARRAAAVKDYLVDLGVEASRILTVSKGKEQPFCTDHNEMCWQQNRRGHFIITAKNVGRGAVAE